MTGNALLYVAAVAAVLTAVAVALFRPRRTASVPTAHVRATMFEGELYLNSADVIAALRKAGHKDMALNFLAFERRHSSPPTHTEGIKP